MFPRRCRCAHGLTAAVAACWLVLVLTVAPVQGAEPARVSVKTQAGSAGGLRITALVLDAAGAPVPDAPVVFKVRTAFGWLTVGERTTDEAGVSAVDLPAGPSPGEVAVEVGDEAQVRGSIRLRREEPAALQMRPGRDALRALSPQPGFISPYPVPLQVILLVVVLGGIWTTYGYVGWLLARIRRTGS